MSNVKYVTTKQAPKQFLKVTLKDSISKDVLNEDSHDVSLQLSPPADHREQELVTLHPEFLSSKTLSVKSVEHIMKLENLFNNIWWKCTLRHKRHLSVLTLLGLVHTWCSGLK